MEERHPVFAYYPPFQRSSAIASIFTSVIRMERYESRFRNSQLPGTVRLKDGYELTIPDTIYIIISYSIDLMLRKVMLRARVLRSFSFEKASVRHKWGYWNW